MRGGMTTLSPRQSQAADMVRKGMSDAEIAEVMGIKRSSVKQLVKQARALVDLPMRVGGRRKDNAFLQPRPHSGA